MLDFLDQSMPPVDRVWGGINRRSGVSIECRR